MTICILLTDPSRDSGLNSLVCCFSSKHLSLRSKSKNCLVRNQDNVSEWSDMSSCGLLFQWASTIKIQLSSMHVGLVQNVHHHLIHCDLVLPYDISKKMLILALKKQSLTVCNIYLLSVLFISSWGIYKVRGRKHTKQMFKNSG